MAEKKYTLTVTDKTNGNAGSGDAVSCYDEWLSAEAAMGSKMLVYMSKNRESADGGKFSVTVTGSGAWDLSEGVAVSFLDGKDEITREYKITKD